MDDIDIDDLLGTPPAPERILKAEAVMAGVTVSWLSQVFRMDPKTVRKRLVKVAPLRILRGDSPIYDIRDAAENLIVPKMDVAAVLRTMRVNDLPQHLQEPYWSALLKKQKYEENSGDLWRTEKVLDLLGDVFITIRDRMQLWAETLAENTEMTEEQQERLRQLVDSLQAEIHSRLVDMPKRRQTYSVVSEIGEDE